MPTTPKAILDQIRKLAKSASKPNIYSELADLFDTTKKGPLQHYALGPMSLLRSALSKEDEEKAAIAFSTALQTHFNGKTSSQANLGAAFESLFKANLLHYEIINLPSERATKITAFKTDKMINEITGALWSKVSEK